MSRFEPPGCCPTCGEWVEAEALSCESCGSCGRTGWSEDASYDGLGVEFEEDRLDAPRKGGSFVYFLIGAAFLVIAIYVFVLRGG